MEGLWDKKELTGQVVPQGRLLGNSCAAGTWEQRGGKGGEGSPKAGLERAAVGEREAGRK